MTFNERRKKALAAAKAAGGNALLVTHLPDVRWLCGFTGSNAALALLGGRGSRTVLFTDGRYTAQAKAEATGITSLSTNCRTVATISSCSAVSLATAVLLRGVSALRSCGAA